PLAARALEKLRLARDLHDVLVALHAHRGAAVPVLVTHEEDLLREERVRGADDRADVEGVLRATDRDPERMADALELASDLVERHAERRDLGHAPDRGLRPSRSQAPRGRIPIARDRGVTSGAGRTAL